ncbi:MAG TPA: DUF4255 domain-containing protein [Bryobacteraceae bacterium]|jgi:hypothetical protein
MSNALAISGVTAVLQYCLNAVFHSPSSVLGAVSVTAVAPDLIQIANGNGGNAPLQVNLFLHQVTPNAAWRNVGLPSLSGDGATRLHNQPLALDLHYLLTAYASEDTQAEALLGYALLMLHENPMLPRSVITTALNTVPAANPLSKFLKTSGLAEQIEMIKITPATLGKEEMAWLWTALKADYRPTFPFQISVVLLQPQFPASFALPVLTRNISAQAGPPARLISVEPPTGQAGFAPGDTVTVSGISLAGASQVVLANPRLNIFFPPFAPAKVTNDSVSFVVPDVPAGLPAGVYNLSLNFTDGGGLVLRTTNIVPLPVTPVILLPAATAKNTEGTLVTVNCKPNVLPNQTASLAMRGTAVPAVPFTAPAATLQFQFPLLSPGSYLARLRVDGVESAVAVNWAATPPAFTGPLITV